MKCCAERMRTLPTIATGLTLVTSLALGQTHDAVLPASGDGPGYVPDIMAAAQPNVAAIRVCYVGVARRSPRLWQGVHSVSIIVNGDGSVSDLVVDPMNANTRRFRACMVPIVRTWHMRAPASHAAMTLTYPATELRMAVEQFR